MRARSTVLAARSEIDPEWLAWTPAQYLEALSNPVANRGFKNDFDAMKWADACVLVLPCGRSAHLELGWCAGAGKFTAILLDDLSVASPGHTFGGAYCNSCGEVEIRKGLGFFRCREEARRRDAREPELMYKCADLVSASLDEIHRALLRDSIARGLAVARAIGGMP